MSAAPTTVTVGQRVLVIFWGWIWAGTVEDVAPSGARLLVRRDIDGVRASVEAAHCQPWPDPHWIAGERAGAA